MPRPYANDVDRITLRAEAHRVLQLNDRGDFTTPSPGQYPHQWNWDAALVALGWAHFDIHRARAEILSLLRAQWRDGMVPHIIYHQGASDYFPYPAFWQTESLEHGGTVLSSGLTQPPVVATVVRILHERFHDDPAAFEFLRIVYPKILAWHRWLHTARAIDDTGLPCLIHPWESGTDNSPRWLRVLDTITPHELPEYHRRDMQHVRPEERPRAQDYERFVFLIDRGRRVRWNAAQILGEHPFLVQDVMFCSIVDRAEQDLLALAHELDADTSEIEGWMQTTRTAFDARFWNQERGLYLDYDVRAGASIPVNTCATFAPLYAGLASPQQVTRLMHDHWNNPTEYAPGTDSRFIVPSTAKNEPDYAPRRYWCGPVWMFTNWLFALGLERYSLNDALEHLRRDSLELIQTQGFREYYDPRNGEGLGAQDFSWTAALALEWTSDH
ncbi:MAG TPA: trehalase family glycosidase [Anaerolineae bacterium]|nr:trehalase family glycosidase [Anaerolineae bacterium]